MSDLRRIDCGIHSIVYVALRPGCPLCDAEKRIEELQESLQEVVHENEHLRERLTDSLMVSDLVMAYRAAAELLDDNDRAFFKEVLYMFRDQSSISLRPLKEERRIKVGGERLIGRIPVGLIVAPRDGDAWAHACTSIGGSAIAKTFDSAVNSVGVIQATKMMVRGLEALLPGRIS